MIVCLILFVTPSEYIHCTKPITCRFYNFLCQSKMICLTITKNWKRCRSSLPVTAGKSITMIYFVQCLSGDFHKENCSATKENKKTLKNRNLEAKLHEFYIVGFNNELWIRKTYKLIFSMILCVIASFFFLAKRLSVALSGCQQHSTLEFFILCETLKGLENVENRYLRWWEFTVCFFCQVKNWIKT